MPLTLTGYVNDKACARRMFDYAVNGITNGAPVIPLVKNNEFATVMNAAGTGTVSLIKADTTDDIRIGPGVDTIVKIFNRPTLDAMALQVKSEFSGVTTAHNCLEVTADWHPGGATPANATAGGNTAVQGTARLYTGHTMTGGSLIGTYGQVCNLGTFSGAGIMAAGLYGLIEDGGTYTAVDHVAAGWFDSHLSQTVTAGTASLLYLTNNGTTTLDSVFFIYPGSKITNLFNIDSVDTGLVSDITAGAATITNWRKIKCYIHGATKYMIVGDVA